jgi:DNA-binding HxlR family transcriptional regulator
MSHQKRSYKQNCALAIALDLVGSRWTLLIIRELLIGPRRFGQLLGNLPGMGTNLLSDRLSELTELGLIERTPSGENRGPNAYVLSQTGRELEPAVQALIRWGMQFDERRRSTQHRRSEWNILPLKAYLRHDLARSWHGSYRLTLDDETHYLSYRNGQLEMTRESVGTIMASIATDSTTAARLSSGKMEMEQAVNEGLLQVEGPEEALQLFFDSFGSNA